MIDVVPNAGVIALGKQGENQAVRVTLPNIRAGAGSILLLHQRSDDQKPYPVPVVEAGGGIIWTVSSTDTAFPGRGQAELQWLGVNGEVAKSVTYQTNTTRSMAEPGPEPDEPLKPYTQAVARDAQAAKDAAASATEAAQIAKASAGRAETAANTAQGAAAAAENVQQSVGALASQVRGDADKVATDKAEAQKAAGDALESSQEAGRQATAAQEAATSARTAADRAAESKGQAETARVGAEEAKSKAEKAAQEAQKAADKARQNVLVGTETGNPISVDDAFAAPLYGLTLYGKSTQVSTTGAQLVSLNDSYGVTTVNGVTKTPIGISVWKLEGISKEDAIIYPYSSSTFLGLSKGDYVFSVFGTSKAKARYTIVGGGSSGYIQTGHSQKISIQEDVKLILNFIVANGVESNGILMLMLNSGSTSLPWEPYTGGEPSPSPDYPQEIKSAGDGGSVAVTLSDGNEKTQTLTLPTPNGLPGIPVTSGGNYTDENGQQWVCDEVDLERGVKVQRVDKAAFDNTKTLAEQNAILATPVETPLSSAEIVAYKALTAYAPDTVVQESDGAGLKLDYQRDVNIVIKKLEDAVASMTAI